MADGNFSVVYKFRDIDEGLVKAWEEVFADHKDKVQITKGDIFKDGPSADAIVSPANSYGFMDGGIDRAYSLHFGWQMQERLQKYIRGENDGEVLVGEAVIITTFEGGAEEKSMDWSKTNEGVPIKYLICAPTMRVPGVVAKTVNAYLAFRAVIRAVKKHNKTCPDDPIRSVLCPGLGTAVGKMPGIKCAFQMLMAYETFELKMHPERLNPSHLFKDAHRDHSKMAKFGDVDPFSKPVSDKTDGEKLQK